jgi:hypothetical protein
MPVGKKAAGGVNKMDAVRQIIAKHGKNTMPVEIVSFAKKEHGVTLTAGTASNYKTAILKKLGSGDKPKPKKGPKPGWKKAAPPNGTTTGLRKAGGISIHDIEAVKKLVEQIGAEKVEQLALVLAK